MTAPGDTQGRVRGIKQGLIKTTDLILQLGTAGLRSGEMLLSEMKSE